MRTTPSVACLISAVIPPIAENSLGVMLFSAEFVARSWFDFTDSVYYEFHHYTSSERHISGGRADEMKKLQEQLAWISKTLAGLVRQVDQVARKVGKAAPAPGRKGRPGRKPAKALPALTRTDTVLESVYHAIRRSRNGLSISQLIAKTKLEPRQLSNALYKLSKKGLVRTRARGIYVKS
jgi:DNA-binding transcriptional ArsR family regulator